MKKSIYSLLFSVFAVMMLTSCGGDDEPAGGGNGGSSASGKVSVTYGNQGTESYKALTPSITLYPDSTYGPFMMGLSADDSYFPEASVQFNGGDEFRQGQKLQPTDIWFKVNGELNSFVYCVDEANGGDVIVKKVTDEYITLEFKDFRFNRHLGGGEKRYQEVTLNGEVKFIIDIYPEY